METFCAIFELFYKSETVLKSKVYKNITISVLKIESYISYSAALDIELVSSPTRWENGILICFSLIKSEVECFFTFGGC